MTVDTRTLEVLQRHDRANASRRTRQLTRLLVAADCLGLVVAFAVTRLAYPDTLLEGTYSNLAELMLFLLTLPCWVVVAKLYGLYDRDEERTDHSTADDFSGRLPHRHGRHLVLLLGAARDGAAAPALPKLVVFWAHAISLVVLGRAARARPIAGGRSNYLQNTVIVGAGDVGQLVAQKILQHPEYGINLVGFVDVEPQEPRAGLEHLPMLGAPERPADDRSRAARRRARDHRLLATTRTSETLDLDPLAQGLRRPGRHRAAATSSWSARDAAIHTVEGMPLLGLPPLRLSRSSRLLKRTLDVVVSRRSRLLLLSPLFVVDRAR